MTQLLNPPQAKAETDSGRQRPNRQGATPRRNAGNRLSTISAKVLMALTGLALLGFVAIHMLGNLQIYFGQDSLNAYAAFLKGMPGLLWSARFGLLAVFVAHIGLAFYLRRINRAARPGDYVYRDTVQASLASRTMLLSGLVIAAFVIYHLLHFTLGVTNPTHHQLTDSEGRHDVYSMVVLGFQNWLISGAYLVAMLFLGLHLSHAVSSIFQTFGLNGPRWRESVRRAGLAVASLIVIGNCSIPIAVLLGFVRLPSGVAP